MLKITSGQANVIKVTAVEKATDLNTNFLMVVIKLGNVSYAFNPTSVEVKGSGHDRQYVNLTLASTVFLQLNVFYEYTIYEQSNNTNQDPADGVIVGTVETGRVKVSGTDTNTYSYVADARTYIA